ncbi:MAG: ABC transporter substrate-binding protein [Clostridia bacterium]|nr:ABC transporter substrate-binding protein [Clostridia bacterium]
MNFKRIICFFLCFCLILPVLSGCKSAPKEIIYVNINNKPSTLDPQLAETDEELMICRNIYEGLLRKNEKGEIVEGAAKSYSKSGLTYTFNLRDGLKWSNGDSVTAYDFEYGLKRAVSKNLNAPFANRLRNIKNAPAVLSGGNVSSLGVKASSETQLTITLQKDDPLFLETLTTPVCAPCNESFLNECRGKYGRDNECIISNGSYVLTKWNHDEFGIRLYFKKDYKDDFKEKNGGVFISSIEDEKIETLFKKESVDCAIVDNNDVKAVKKSGAKLKSVQNICWFMTVGKCYSKNVRNAFLSALSKDVYSSSLPSGFSYADSVYPSSLNVGNRANGVGITPYNLENAKNIISDAVRDTDDKQFPASTLYYYDDESMLSVIKTVVGHYQQNLCAFINISPAKHPEELKGELKNANLQFSVFPVEAKGTDVSEYLSNFGIKADTDTVKAQQQILSKKTVIPLCFENTNICYSKSLGNINFDNSDGFIDFSFVTKK